MADRRRPLPPRRPPGPNGELYCRRCGDQLSGRRQTWCSDDCVQLAEIEAGWQGACRRYLWERERGRCQRCGLDTDVLDRWLARLRGRAQSLETWVRYGSTCLELARRGFNISVGPFVEALMECPSPDLYEELAAKQHRYRYMPSLGPLWIEIRSLWEADHIVPIVEDGPLSADNLQTLCVPCHKTDTAELAARRAAERDPQGTLFESGCTAPEHLRREQNGDQI